MAEVIKLKNGTTHTLFGMDDALLLIDQHMGSGFREWLEDHMVEPDYDELETENKQLRAHHRKVMEDLREQSEAIAGLIWKKTIDRSKLSTVAGKIGNITRRELL